VKRNATTAQQHEKKRDSDRYTKSELVSGGDQPMS
jgi:hypothetical protein